MAIQFARAKYVSRSSGGNACCKGAYNSRSVVTDSRTGTTYDFSHKGDSLYHEVLLPDHVDQKFSCVSVLMNEIERVEKRKNSQLVKEFVLALPDEDNISLEMKKEMVLEFIMANGFVKNGLAVQVDIHDLDEFDKNSHAHLLVTTRKFSSCGKFLDKKARDLEPIVRNGSFGNYVYYSEDIDAGITWKNIQNAVFERHALENRVDDIGLVAQEHIGPVRMRKHLNEKVVVRDEIVFANDELLISVSDVINKITRKVSVFNESNVRRAVKCINDKDRAESLVQEILKSDELLELFDSNGNKTGFYTTRQVREEELKLIRLGSYISNTRNVCKNLNLDSASSNNSKSISNQQKDAIRYLLKNKSGIGILKGRAGTGKSYVLGHIVKALKESKIKVVGLAPTHKAVKELKCVGYENSDTIKGFLFKLHNGKVTLESGSVIVVDEASMVSNADYLELLRISAAKKCNVILSGDERQLSSIERGGIFESFAQKFGCFELSDIKRQQSIWARSVAKSFSVGDVNSGISILKSNGKLISSKTKDDSIESLVHNWNKSSESIENRLVIAIKNSDVDLINRSIRETLKKNCLLSDDFFIVSEGSKKVFFSKNDRIIFTSTNKSLNIHSGDFATLISLTSTEFTAKLDSNLEVKFNPHETKFSHGYASTVYKAQGASIRDVFVLHDGFSTIQNSYVAMSRHINDIHLYINKEKTKSDTHLINQLLVSQNKSSSLSYLTMDNNHFDLDKNNQNKKNTIFNSIKNAFKYQITKLIDKHVVNEEYYTFESTKISQDNVSRTIAKVYEIKISNDNRNHNEIVRNITLEDKITACGESLNIQSTRSNINLTVINNQDSMSRKPTKKELFYKNVDRLKNQNENKLKEQREQVEILRREIQFSSERITKQLLGSPNKYLSNSSTLRYGDNGSLAVCISGSKAGSWYDFSECRGGDLFDLVQIKQGCSFKESVSFLNSITGLPNNFINEHSLRNNYNKHIETQNKEKALKESKIRTINNLFDKSNKIENNNSNSYIQSSYLKNRSIKTNLSQDIRSTTIFNHELKRKIPAIIAFARDKNNNITGCQQILLDDKTHSKANVTTPKKSLGVIAGSFVEVKPYENNTNNKITIIAEGIETALSIKQSIEKEYETKDKTNANTPKDRNTEKEQTPNIRIICSLGISNIKNYKPNNHERIIIASDNDGENSKTNKVINDAKEILSHNAIVEVVKPKILGDFNDVLRNNQISENSETKEQDISSENSHKNSQTKTNQELEIRNIFIPTIKKLQLFSDNEIAIITKHQKTNEDKSEISDLSNTSKSPIDQFIEEHKDIIAYNIAYNIFNNHKFNTGDEYSKDIVDDYQSIIDNVEHKNINSSQNKVKNLHNNLIHNLKTKMQDLNDTTRIELLKHATAKIIENEMKIIDLKKSIDQGMECDNIQTEEEENITSSSKEYEHAITNEYKHNKKAQITTKHELIHVSLTTRNNAYNSNILTKRHISTISTKFKSKIDYLEHSLHNKTLRTYVKDFCENKIHEIRSTEMRERLETFRQQIHYQQQIQHDNQRGRGYLSI